MEANHHLQTHRAGQERGPEQRGRSWVEGGDGQKDKLYLLANSAQTNCWRNIALKWDTELTLSHLCLSRALMLTHKKGDNETETKKGSKEQTRLLRTWVTGSRNPPRVP